MTDVAGRAGVSRAAVPLVFRDAPGTRDDPEDGGTAAGADERRQGFGATVAAAGLVADVEGGGLCEDDGVAAAERLLARPQLPTGLAVLDDQSVTGLLGVPQQAGRRWPP